MKRNDIVVPLVELTYDELDSDARELVDAARRYTFNAYAPYSHFKVGAAIRLENGTIVCGANQENAAFPSGTCAERSACYWAGAQYPGVKFRAIAIAARGTDDHELQAPCAPCGACRQALLEYETLAGRGVTVYLVGRDIIYRVESVRDLLPLAFVSF